MNGAQWVKLDDLTEPGRSITYGVVKPGEEPLEGGVLLVRGGDIGQGRIAADLRRISEEVSAPYRRTLLRGGELVMSLVGNPGAVAVVPETLRGANLARQAALIALVPEVDARFVMYWFMSPMAKQRLASVTKGSVQQVINLADLKRQEVLLPPLETQRRIASILGAYDDLIEVNRRRVAVLEEMARGLFEEWFVRFRFPGHETLATVETLEGRLPEGWQTADLRDLCRGKTGIQTGPFGSQLHQEDYSDEGVPVVMPKNIAGLRVDTNGIARIPEALADSLGRHRMETGDIVYGRRGDIGRRAFISRREQGYFCGTGCLRLRPDPRIVAPRYLFMALGTAATEGAIKARATGATMPNLSAGVMAEVPVLLPAFGVQSAFVSLAAPIADLVANLQAANMELAASRDLLLPRLISGQLSVETAERELAEVA